MLRRKFKGPRASAASQVVSLKPGEGSQETPPESTAKDTVVEVNVTDSDPVCAPSPQPQVLSPQKPLSSILVDKSKKKVFEGIRSPVRFVDPAEIEPSDVSAVHHGKSDAEDTGYPKARTRTSSHSSVISIASVSSATSYDSLPKKRKKRVFDEDESYDPTKFTMADLIDYKPKGENNLRTKWKDLEKKFKEEGFQNIKVEKTEPTDQEIAPRIKLDADGNPIIDEESLVVRRNPEAHVLETVDDDLLPKKINSLSFKKNYFRATTWTNLETELFYEVLSATGTDFSLMHEYLPFKSRLDIKKKFCREEKTNMTRINETLRHPTMLNARILEERVRKMMVLIDRENEIKQALKDKKARKRKISGSTDITVSTDVQEVIDPQSEVEEIQEKEKSVDLPEETSSSSTENVAKKRGRPKAGERKADLSPSSENSESKRKQKRR
ncbi:hypothetical protein FO519_008241 [Halicephalobus sp. NKZ332]|nr:hypothetical protein FO519_008241 [Halicephalobus sp. NKZ332]